MLHEFKLASVNSATKYPSINTYHRLDPLNQGRLSEQHSDMGKGPLIVTEKVDGTNGRIVLLPSGEWVIGSREDFLTAKGDYTFNKALGIVEALRPIADRLTPPHDCYRVVFVEVYGHGINGGQQYTGSGKVGVRLFDVVEGDLVDLKKSPSALSGWRDRGGQEFLRDPQLSEFAIHSGLDIVPRLGVIDSGELPTTLADTYDFLQRIAPRTKVKLDEYGRGQAEGVVIRTPDRTRIVKLRHQDYARTFTPRNHHKKGRA